MGGHKQTIHKLKTDPQAFEDISEGIKKCEIRLNDRNYREGDLLDLHETQYSYAEMQTGASLIYTGRVYTALVTHVQSGYGLKDGHVALSIEEY
jgi:hypothetical protein